MLQNNNSTAIKNLAVKSFKINKERNLFVILTLALTAFMITSIFSIGSSYIKTNKFQQLRLMGTNAHVAFINPNDKQIDILQNKLSDYIIDTGISHRLGSIVDYQNDSLLGLGWLDKTEWKKHRLPTISNVTGQYPVKENEIMMPSWALEELGIDRPLVGMTVTLSYRLSTSMDIQTQNFELSGFYLDYSQIRTNNKGSVYVSEIFRDKTGISISNGGAAMLRLTNTDNISKTCNIISQRLSLTEGQDFEIVPIYRNSDNSLSLLLSIIIFFVFFSGYLLIYNVIYISVSKDIRFYGLLKTIGTTKKQIKRLVQWQILKLCGIGIPLGLFVGATASFVIIPMSLKTLFPTIVDKNILISFSPFIFIGAAIFTLITAWSGSMKPAKIAGSISPIEAIRYVSTDSTKIIKRKSRNGGNPFSMAWRNVFRNKKSALVTFLSLFFGLTTFLLTTGLLTSLSPEAFVEDWEDSDFIITYDISKTQNEPITESIVEQIKNINNIQDMRITTALPSNNSMRNVDVIYDDDVFSKYILSFAENPNIKSSVDFSDPAVRKSYTENFYAYIYGLDSRYIEEINQTLNRPINISEFETGNIVLLSEVLDRKGSSVFTPGKIIQIKIPNTDRMISYQIASGFLDAGFQSSRGNVRGTAPNMYISKAAMLELTDHPSIFRIDIKSNQKQDAEILSKLKEITAIDRNIVILSKYEKAEEFRGYLATTRVLGIGLSSILFLIGIMNFINTMYVSIAVRHKELAILESIGMLKKQMKKMLIYEGLIYAFITILLVGGIGSSILYASFIPLKSVAGYAVFTYPFFAMVTISFIVLLVCIVIPMITYKVTANQSVVQRLRSVD